MKNLFLCAANYAVIAALICIGCDNGISGNSEKVDRYLINSGAPNNLSITTFTDSRDGNSYKKVTIGTQTWMAENLNYDVPSVTSDVCYDNSAGNCVKYGRLYNWSTAMGGASSSSNSPSGVQGICPAGWHIPSDAEWTTLVNYAGGESTAGRKLKSTTGWDDRNGTDQYGFSALPGGNGSPGGYFGSAGYYGYWWSATENYANYVMYRYMNYGYDNVYRYGSNDSKILYSVRCVQDGNGSNPTTYTVTFDANGGTVSPTSGTTGTNGKLTSLPTPTRDGYTFAGWYTASTGGTAVTANTVFSGNATIYAQWTLSTYTVTFDANGGTVSPTSATIGADGKLTSLPLPTRDGYTFAGWYTASAAGMTVTANTIFSENVTIYAQWVLPTTYTVTFNANGGTVSPTSSTINADRKLIYLPTPTRDGYTFAGWYTAAAGGTAVTANTVFSGNATIYAQWILSTYTVTFDANGGTVSPTSGTTDADGKLTSLPTPTRDGYTFAGWYTASAGGMTVRASTIFSGNTTIYAQWTIVSGGGDTFIDGRDGKIYKRVTIGTQSWMTENLDYDVEGSKCYDNDPANCEKYGRLYNWETALTACPAGWHIPSDAEWTVLTNFVDSNAGTKLKSQTGWNSDSRVPAGTDQYGWSALPGGNGLSDGSFSLAGGSGLWWSATENGADIAWGRNMDYLYENVYRINGYKTYLFSVRCAQDW